MEKKRNSENSRKKEDAAKDEDVKRALHYTIEVTVCPQVKISEGRSCRACETGTVGTEEEGRGNAVVIPFSSSTH